MSIRSYGAVTTGVLGGVFGFDLLWVFTEMEAFHAMFAAMMIGLFMALGFVFATEPREPKKPKYEFQTDETGLSVLVRRKA